MKKLLFITSLLVSNFCFSQAREYSGFDTVTHRPGYHYYDTLPKIQADSPIVATIISPYLLKLSLSAGFLGGTWTASTLYPTKMYAGIGTNTYTRVGIGTDTPHAPLQIKTPMPTGTVTDSSGIILSNDSTSTATKQYYSPPLTLQGRGWAGTRGDQPSKIRIYNIPISGTPSNQPSLVIDGWDNSSNQTWQRMFNLQSFGYGGGSIRTGFTLGAGSYTMNFGVTDRQIDAGGLSISGTGSGMNVNGSGNFLYFKTNGYYTDYGVYFKLASGYGWGVNDFTALTQPNPTVIADFASQNGFKGILIPRSTTNQRDSITGSILTVTISNAGSAYTNGSYVGITLTGGSGSGIKGNFTVSGGIITVATIPSTIRGINYQVGDVLSIPALGGTGSGGTVTVATVNTAARNLMLMDSSVNQLSIHNHDNSWTGKVFTSSASTLTLDYGDDYIFTGTTATYTLPTILTNTQGRQNGIKIKNRGSGTITLNSASGSTIYSTSAVSTINIIAGAACELMPDGTYFNVMSNN